MKYYSLNVLFIALAVNENMMFVISNDVEKPFMESGQIGENLIISSSLRTVATEIDRQVFSASLRVPSTPQEARFFENYLKHEESV